MLGNIIILYFSFGPFNFQIPLVRVQQAKAFYSLYMIHLKVGFSYPSYLN